MEYQDKSAAELGRLIDSGKADPAEVAECFLEAAARHPDSGLIYSRMTPDRAMEEARNAHARAREGRRLGPLDGVPVSWKDLFDTKGIATESGAKLLAGRVPQEDAEVLGNATSAGTICLGKTHQTEFAFSGLGVNPNTATPPNLGMPGHAPGGSSSGAAASIAHGLAPIAIGSDTGGSVRIPACWNSLVGLKTTHGVLSLRNVVPLCPGFDTVGPIARTVEDAALMFHALGGPQVDPDDRPALASLRFAVVETIALEGCDERQLAAFETSLRSIGRAGADISRIKAPEYERALELGAILFPFEAWESWGELISANPGITYAPVEERFRQGANITPEAYASAWSELHELRSGLFERMGTFDGVLSPTVPIAPPPVDALLGDDELFIRRNLLTLRNTRFVNLLGSCALTLPTSTYAAGLQVMGRPGEDGRLLQIGAALESIVA